MFSGIVETTGRILDIRRQGSNIDIDLECPFAQTLKIDQSIAKYSETLASRGGKDTQS